MEPQRMKFSVKDMLQIHQEVEQFRISQKLPKHKPVLAVIRPHQSRKNPGFIKPRYHKLDQQAKTLQEENVILRKIIANQALELQAKAELLREIAL